MVKVRTWHPPPLHNAWSHTTHTQILPPNVSGLLFSCRPATPIFYITLITKYLQNYAVSGLPLFSRPTTFHLIISPSRARSHFFPYTWPRYISHNTDTPPLTKPPRAWSRNFLPTWPRSITYLPPLHIFPIIFSPVSSAPLSNFPKTWHCRQNGHENQRFRAHSTLFLHFGHENPTIYAQIADFHTEHTTI